MSETQTTILTIMLTIVYWTLWFAFIFKTISVDTFAIVFMLYTGFVVLLVKGDS